MSEAPERIWIEDEFGDGDKDQWTYGTWDVRNYAGYNVEYVRADRIEALTDALDNLLEAITAEDQFHDRSLTITGSTANLRWLLEAEEDARAVLKVESHD